MTFASLSAFDDIYRLDQADAFSPSTLLAELGAELSALPAETVEELGTLFDNLAAVMGDIERFAPRVMGLRMSQTPALGALPAPMRTLVTQTVSDYDGKLALLQERVHAGLARHDRDTADALTAEIVAAAERTLQTRSELRAGVLALGQRSAEERMSLVERWVQNRALLGETRDRWLRARVELRAILADPRSILAGRFVDRLAKQPTPADEPAPESTVSTVSLLEVD